MRKQIFENNIMRDEGFLFLILSVVNISGVPVSPILESEVLHQIIPGIIQNGGPQSLSGVIFKTAIKYYCKHPLFIQNSTTILYGTNGWTFPAQDVDLTLSYPTSNANIAREEFDDYKISGYQVIMYTDGSKSTGYIAAGGLLQNYITLKFTMSDITVLWYEFWLYGVPATTAAAAPSYLQTYQLC